MIDMNAIKNVSPALYDPKSSVYRSEHAVYGTLAGLMRETRDHFQGSGELAVQRVLRSVGHMEQLLGRVPGDDVSSGSSYLHLVNSQGGRLLSNDKRETVAGIAAARLVELASLRIDPERMIEGIDDLYVQRCRDDLVEARERLGALADYLSEEASYKAPVKSRLLRIGGAVAAGFVGAIGFVADGGVALANDSSVVLSPDSDDDAFITLDYRLGSDFWQAVRSHVSMPEGIAFGRRSLSPRPYDNDDSLWSRVWVALGITLSDPELKYADRDIDGARADMIGGLEAAGLTVSGVGEWEKWADVGLGGWKPGLSLKLGVDLPRLYDWEFALGASVTKSKGGVESSGRFQLSADIPMIHPIAGLIIVHVEDSDSAYEFEQIYDTTSLALHATARPPISLWGVRPYTDFGPMGVHLNSKTKLDVGSDVFGVDQGARAEFDEWGLGAFGGLGLEWERKMKTGRDWPFSDGDFLSAYMEAKWQWMLLEGKTDVRVYDHGRLVQQYRTRNKVDMDGPVAVGALRYSTDKGPIDLAAFPFKLPVWLGKKLIVDPVRAGIDLLRQN